METSSTIECQINEKNQVYFLTEYRRRPWLWLILINSKSRTQSFYKLLQFISPSSNKTSKKDPLEVIRSHLKLTEEELGDEKNAQTTINVFLVG